MPVVQWLETIQGAPQDEVTLPSSPALVSQIPHKPQAPSAWLRWSSLPALRRGVWGGAWRERQIEDNTVKPRSWGLSVMLRGFSTVKPALGSRQSVNICQLNPRCGLGPPSQWSQTV